MSDFDKLVKRSDVIGVSELLARIPNVMDRVALVNQPSSSGSTALFTAAWNGSLLLCELLINNGAKVNWSNLRANTAIMMAIEQNHYEVVEFLLKSGAVCDPKEAQRIRDATKKVIDQRIDDLLARYAAESSASSAVSTTIAPVSLASSTTESRSAVSQSFSDLLACVQSGRVDELQTILSRRRELRQAINDTNADGQTVLFFAASSGNCDLLKLLLLSGADANHRDHQLRSALHFSIAGNHFAATRLLLEEGRANTTGIDMRQIRFAASCNISNRIDQLLKRYAKLYCVLSHFLHTF